MKKGQYLLDHHFAQSVKHQTGFENTDKLYRLLEDDDSKALNHGDTSQCQALSGDRSTIDQSQCYCICHEYFIDLSISRLFSIYSQINLNIYCHMYIKVREWMSDRMKHELTFRPRHIASYKLSLVYGFRMRR